MPQAVLAIAGLIAITVALIGQGIEMRKIRIRTYGEGEVGHPNIFLDKKNVKWYILIAIGFGLAYSAQFA
jgi:hypothetical protein|tara:strand:- start:92 stop:301 length:210 start_codon:yes stop_codon:yes gene_type:complete